MSNLHVVILAAGKSTRMKSAQPKVLHRLAGRSLIAHVLHSASTLAAQSTTVVVGHGAADVQAALANHPGLQFVTQFPQMGTGHALLQAEPLLEGQKGTVLLLYADVPLLSAATLRRLIETHHAKRAVATVLTAMLADPYGYGRIVRDAKGEIVRIVEERDASAEERVVGEINTGIYTLALDGLFESVHGLAADNAQGEYYLTDLVAQYRRQGRRVETMCVSDAEEIRGVNSRVDLADVARIVRARKNRDLMMAGVSIEDPATAYIDQDVVIGPDTVIGPGVRLEGKTVIGMGCRVHAGVRVTDGTIGDAVTVLDHSVIVSSTVDAGAQIGPFAHLRPDSHVCAEARVGNFVELKKTTLGRGSKASHLTYLGDATIGADVNIGAGTITCNYDGEKKHPTVIEDGAFIGSDSQLVAPVRVGKGAYVAAGSSITADVPADSLAIARARQVVKEGWTKRRTKGQH
jgi:bifunctional UDP-N-acetylglucosamine pyrophosphorylase/glucosamine-1-phosphate N-acetyltransferase